MLDFGFKALDWLSKIEAIQAHDTTQHSVQPAESCMGIVWLSNENGGRCLPLHLVSSKTEGRHKRELRELGLHFLLRCPVLDRALKWASSKQGEDTWRQTHDLLEVGILDQEKYCHWLAAIGAPGDDFAVASCDLLQAS